MKRNIFIVLLITLVLLSSVIAFADDTQTKAKDWKLLTSFAFEWNKVNSSKALVLTVEYDKFFNDNTILFGGIGVDYYLTLPANVPTDSPKTFINPFVGVDYKISNVTTLEARVDYDVKAKAPIIKVQIVWEW